MVQKHRLACRLTGYLLAVALVAVSCLVPGIAASAAAPTYTAYKAGFEESVYDGSARHVVTQDAQFVRSGKQAAKLTGSYAGNKDHGSDSSLIYLYDDKGAKITMKANHFYYVGFYVKASKRASKFSVSIAWSSSPTYAQWAGNGNMELALPDEWRYVLAPVSSVSNGNQVALYINEYYDDTTDFYIDDATVFEFETAGDVTKNTVGLVAADPRDGGDVQIYTGKVNDAIALDNLSKAGDEFLGWYRDVPLSLSASGLKYTTAPQIVYGGWKSYKDAFHYNAYTIDFEGAAYNNGDYRHVTDEAANVMAGHAAKLSGTYDTSGNTGKPTNMVYLFEQSGAQLVWKLGYYYYIGFYLKADPSAGQIKIAASHNTGWAGAVSLTPTGGWDYVELRLNKRDNLALNEIIGLYFNGDNYGGKPAPDIYIDNVTVLEVAESSYGVLRFDGRNEKDVTLRAGRTGSGEADLPTPQKDGDAFAQWYTDASLTTPAEDVTYTDGTQTLYAGYASDGKAQPTGDRTYKVDFENTAVYNNTDNFHVTTDPKFVRSGKQAAKLTEHFEVNYGTADSFVYLMDEAGAHINLQKDTLLYFGFYLKASKPTGRVVVSASHDNAWAKNSWVDAAGPDEWVYLQMILDMQTANAAWDGKPTGLYVQSPNGEFPEDTEFYIDDVTVQVITDLTAGVVAADPQNGEDVQISVGAAGTKPSFTQPNKPGDAFLGWYKDVLLTQSADGVTQTAKTAQMVYAGWQSYLDAVHPNIYTVDFEDEALYNDTDRRHVTTDPQFVHTGRQAAKLAGPYKNSVDNGTVTSHIQLNDQNGTPIKMQAHHYYFISFYVKANKVIDRFTISPSHGTSWAANANGLTANPDEWTYVHTLLDMTGHDGWNNELLGLYINGYADDEAIFYLDDVTIIESDKKEFGVVRVDRGDGSNYSYKVGRQGDAVDLTPPTDSTDDFIGWFLDPQGTQPADGMTYSSELQTLYAKFNKTSWRIDYEAGAGYGWTAGSETLKTDNVSVTDAQRHGGSYAVKLESDGADASFVLADRVANGYAPKFAYAASRQYVVRYWYYVPAGVTPAGSATLQTGYTNKLDVSGVPTAQKGALATLTFGETRDKWVAASVTVTTPAWDDSLANGGLVLQWTNPGAGTTVYFDDIQIIRIDDAATAEAIGLSSGDLQMLNDAAFEQAGGDRQAIRFQYYLRKDTMNGVTLRGMQYTVQEVGMLTALTTLLPGDVNDALTLAAVETNRNIKRTTVTSDRTDPAGSGRKYFTAYLKNIEKAYINFNVSSRAYVVLRPTDGGDDIVIYTDVTTVSVYGLLKAAQTGGVDGYDKSYKWGLEA